MNPWDIVSWIGAIAVAILIIACTVSVIANLIKPKRSGSKRVL